MRTFPLTRAPLPARSLRFVVCGGLATGSQLLLLALLLHWGWAAVAANVLAFLLATQLNFALSALVTWGDRWPARDVGRWLGVRWLRYHAAICGGALLNQGVFLVARHWLPALLAAALGAGIAAIGNFMLSDRLVFRPIGASSALDARARAKRA